MTLIKVNITGMTKVLEMDAKGGENFENAYLHIAIPKCDTTAIVVSPCKMPVE